MIHLQALRPRPYRAMRRQDPSIKGTLVILRHTNARPCITEQIITFRKDNGPLFTHYLPAENTAQVIGNTLLALYSHSALAILLFLRS